ncbi:NGG1-interacting factor 3 [Cucumispora dikerogammari]|nr:NGG1-interacting factor 3 [Cucumispora dikerogammari]
MKKNPDDKIWEYLQAKYTPSLPFDNTGILIPLSLPETFGPDSKTKVVFTIDLTPKLINKYKKSEIPVIFICYHPPLFAPIKRISKSLKTLVSNFCVISPHTMLDPAMNIDLAFYVMLVQNHKYEDLNSWNNETYLHTKNSKEHFKIGGLYINLHKRGPDATVCLLENIDRCSIEEIIKNIKDKLKIPFVTVYPNFNPKPEPYSLNKKNIKFSLNSTFKYLLVGVGATYFTVDTIYAVITKTHIDDFNINMIEDSLIIVGEMKHHEILKLQKNNTIIVTGHSQSERFFLLTLYKDLDSGDFKHRKEYIMEVADETEDILYV